MNRHIRSIVRYNRAGNLRGNAAIAGVGKEAVDDAGVIPGTIPHVQLGIPVLLGTLITPEGVGVANFEATPVGLLNVAGLAESRLVTVVTQHAVVPSGRRV